MKVSGKVTVAVLAQALNDHLDGCETAALDTNRRLGRIEGVMITVAASIILQLIAVCAFLFSKVHF